MSDDFELAVPLPLDGDGFLRRECPTCQREFKWHPSEDERESDPVPVGGYFCPYCAVQAPADSWLTKPQLAMVEAVIHAQVVAPRLEEFERNLKALSRRSGGSMKVESEREERQPPDPLSEPDDMREVQLTCHPREPLKVLESWSRPVHCVICGAPNGA